MLLPGIYNVIRDEQLKQYTLYKTQERFQTQPKLYGSIVDDAIRLWNGFVLNKKLNDNSSIVALLTGKSGSGKALHKNSKVKKLSGWCYIKDVKVNDIIIGDDGYPTKVIGFYPQGVKNLYEITFKDGRKSKCCGEHLWCVSEYGETNKKVVNTEYLYNSFDTHAIPLCKPSINSRHSLQCSEEEFGLKVRNGLVERIPTCYLDNTPDVREKLLSVILKLPIDSYFNIIFTTVNEYLANDIVYLARSLGLVAKSTLIENDTKQDAVVGYSINIYRDIYNQLQIVDIKEVESDEAYCIEVSNTSKLYITDDFIVTHNTETIKVLSNIAIDNYLPVIVVKNIEVTLELLSMLDSLNNVVIVMDEFGKIVNHSLQEKALTMFSNVDNKNRIIVLSENQLARLNQFMTSNSGRIQFHLEYNRVSEKVVDEVCDDFAVGSKFRADLKELHKKSPEITIADIQLLATQHKLYPNDTFNRLIEVCNVKRLKPSSQYVLTSIIDTRTDAKLKFNPKKLTDYDIESSYINNVTVTSESNTFTISFSSADIKNIEDTYINYEVDGYLLKFENKVATGGINERSVGW